MCSRGSEETVKHLFFECEFAQNCWMALHIVWDLALPVVDMIEQQRSQFPSDCYMEVIMIAAWVIWIHQNYFIFNNELIYVRTEQSPV
jgi:hypothetical protein